jgi:hypothetical protein
MRPSSIFTAIRLPRPLPQISETVKLSLRAGNTRVIGTYAKLVCRHAPDGPGTDWQTSVKEDRGG